MPFSPNYRIQAKNATAVNILRSWLRALGIQVLTPDVPGFDLAVEKRATAGRLNVQVYLEGAQKPQEGVGVPAKAFTGKNPERALAAFYEVTDAAGYDRQSPVNRGGDVRRNDKGNPRKLHYQDEDFLVTIRHNEFRRSPNPPADRWEQYRSTMEKVSRAFLSLNRELCERHSLDLSDLMQHARCYVVNFCARYETPDPVWFDNERKCYRYLQQRFNSDLRSILLKKERSMMPDGETVRIAMFSTPHGDVEVSPNPTDVYITALDNREAVQEIRRRMERGEELEDLPEEFEVAERADYDYIRRNCELDTSSPAARKASVTAKLAELLSGMPHDQMVEVLRRTADNLRFDYVTRKEALRQLRLHSSSCAPCDGVREEEEDTAGADALGAEE